MYKLYKVDFPSIYVAAQSDKDAQDFVDSELDDTSFLSDLENYTAYPINKEDDVKYDIDPEAYIPYGQPEGMEMTARELLKVSKLVKGMNDEQLTLVKELINYL